MLQARRQNTACDACRARKVKCNQAPGEERCAHCISKNYPCTHHAQQETEKKRSMAGRRVLHRNPIAASLHPTTPDYLPESDLRSAPDYAPVSNARDQPRGTAPTFSSSYSVSGSPHGDSGSSPVPPHLAPSNFERRRHSSGSSIVPGAAPAPPHSYCPPDAPLSAKSAASYPYPGLPPPPHSSIHEFLAYLFSHDPTSTAAPTLETLQARRKLQDQDYRVEFASELLEVFFQVYHPRLPVVNPTRFRAQFREALYPSRDVLRNDDHHQRGGREGSVGSSTSASGSTATSNLKPIHRPLLATLLAWGSKFSDHSLLVIDRQQTQIQAMSSDPSGSDIQPSNISRLLVDRAREVAEQDKVFRVAKPENVVVCLLLEPLQPLHSYPTTDPEGSDEPQAFRPMNGRVVDSIHVGLKCLWLNSAIRHLVQMQVNRHPANPVPAAHHPTGDPDEWGCMVFCWWIVCLVDGLVCSFYRQKPVLSEDDYDLKEFRLLSRPSQAGTSRSQEEFVVRVSEAFPHHQTSSSLPSGAPQKWYGSHHDLAICSRNIARALWTPKVERDGVPIAVLDNLMSSLSTWRDQHLAAVGATNDLQNHGDYVTAVGACSSDCSYHVMWIILSDAIGDYGIKEVNEAMTSSSRNAPAASGSGNDKAVNVPSHVAYMVDTERVLANEAYKSATRIAGLAGVLTTNGYMRLDPNAMHWPIYSAGRLLARLGRQEVFNCIDGLNQNGFAYEESWVHAKELKETFTAASNSGGAKDANALLHPYNRRLSRTPWPNAGAPSIGTAAYDAYAANHEYVDPADLTDGHHVTTTFNVRNDYSSNGP